MNYADPSGHSLAVIALTILGILTVAGGVVGGFYEGSFYSNLTGQNQTTETQQLSFWDRLGNIALGAALGLAIGGAAVMLIAVGVGIAVGGATVAIAGGTAVQMFAIGALAYNVFGLVSMLWSGSEVELVELETTKLPY